MPTKLFLGNLPDEFLELAELLSLCERYGRVLSFKIHNGFAFLVMETQAAAKKLVSAVNGYSFHGRVLKVEFAVNDSDGSSHSDSADGSRFQDTSYQGSSAQGSSLGSELVIFKRPHNSGSNGNDENPDGNGAGSGTGDDASKHHQVFQYGTRDNYNMTFTGTNYFRF